MEMEGISEKTKWREYKYHAIFIVSFLSVMMVTLSGSLLDNQPTASKNIYNPRRNYLDSKSWNTNMSNVKHTLLFTKFFGKDWPLQMGSATFEECPVSNCVITKDRQYLSSISEFDAILFHYKDIDMLKTSQLPNQKHRRSNQRYVMYFSESPLNYDYEYDRFSNFFNWTMTYRLDSDIPNPYGRIVQRQQQKMYVPNLLELGQWGHTYDPKEFTISLESKGSEKFRALAHRPRAVAWIVSHCGTGSDRERYVNELRRHIQVDIYGLCGNGRCESCPANNFQNPLCCADNIERDYMFYLAFENSLCDQYVTEKLWSWLKKDILPVVLGQANYTAITPPHSVINAMNYPNPKDLAAHLLKLMSNETEYLSYFWWKEFYEVDQNRKKAFCRLCQMLNDAEQIPKVHDNFGKWWVRDARCKAKFSLPWSKYKPVKEGRWRR